MTNGIPRDQKDFYGVCPMPICTPHTQLEEPGIPPGHTISECLNLAWTGEPAYLAFLGG